MPPTSSARISTSSSSGSANNPRLNPTVSFGSSSVGAASAAQDEDDLFDRTLRCRSCLFFPIHVP